VSQLGRGAGEIHATWIVEASATMTAAVLEAEPTTVAVAAVVLLLAATITLMTRRPRGELTCDDLLALLHCTMTTPH